MQQVPLFSCLLVYRQSYLYLSVLFKSTSPVSIIQVVLLPVSEMWPTKETDWNRVMDDYMRDCNCIFSVSHLHRIGAVINLTAYNLKTGTKMQCGKQLLQHKHWNNQRCLVNIQCAEIHNNKVIPESWSVSSHRDALLTRSIIQRPDDSNPPKDRSSHAP